ncbi:MAG: hypothetical protein ACREQZ_14485 [Woeseiaceae bacterium]
MAYYGGFTIAIQAEERQAVIAEALPLALSLHERHRRDAVVA